MRCPFCNELTTEEEDSSRKNGDGTFTYSYYEVCECGWQGPSRTIRVRAGGNDKEGDDGA